MAGRLQHVLHLARAERQHGAGAAAAVDRLPQEVERRQDVALARGNAEPLEPRRDLGGALAGAVRHEDHPAARRAERGHQLAGARQERRPGPDAAVEIEPEALQALERDHDEDLARPAERARAAGAGPAAVTAWRGAGRGRAPGSGRPAPC